MRGSFKQIQKKKKGVWSPSLSHSALLLLKTIWLFALQSANLFFFFFFFFLSHTFHPHSLSLMFMYVHLEFHPVFFFFLNMQPVMLSFATVGSLFFVVISLLFLFFFFSSSMPFHYLSLSLYLCIILVNGKQRCHCGSILSAQRVADGRNLCRL